jgi:hypothetical protein
MVRITCVACRWPALAALGLVVSACAMTSRYDQDFVTAPEPIHSDWPLARDRCSNCHEIERVMTDLRIKPERYPNLDYIELLVDDMARKRGSGISAAEIPRIADVLEWYMANHVRPRMQAR